MGKKIKQRKRSAAGGFEPHTFHTQTLKTSARPLGRNANSFKNRFHQNIY